MAVCIRIRRPRQADRMRPKHTKRRRDGFDGGYDYSFVEGTGHLLQVEKPLECALLTIEFLARHGLARLGKHSAYPAEMSALGHKRTLRHV